MKRSIYITPSLQNGSLSYKNFRLWKFSLNFLQNSIEHQLRSLIIGFNTRQYNSHLYLFNMDIILLRTLDKK